MSEITGIKQQQKRNDRFSIFVNGKYSFSLTRDQLAAQNLAVGQSLSDSDIDQLKNSSSFGKLRDLTYRWLSLRLRSKYEIETYLARKTDDEGLKKRLIDELQSHGYIDDKKFATAWISGRTSIKPISTYRLRQELIQKRIPKELINECLASVDLDDVAAAKNIIAKRGHRYKDSQKLMAYLARQGFKYDTIKQALNED